MPYFSLSRGNVLVLAPLLAGVILLVFGAATGSLAISGHAQTGDFDAVWTGGSSCGEFNTWDSLRQANNGNIPDPSMVPDPRNPASAPPGSLGEFLGKSVADTTLALQSGGDQLAISTTTAYPSYGVRCALQYQNTGSLPIRVNASDVTAVSGLTDCTITGTTTLTLACKELTLLFTPSTNSACLQAGESETVDLIYHVEQQARQQSTMAFSIDVPLVQCEVVVPTPQIVIVQPPPAVQPLAPVQGSGNFSQTGGVVATAQPVANPPLISQVGGFTVPKVGDGGLVGRIGLESPPHRSGGGRLLAATAGLLVLFSVLMAGVRRARRHRARWQ